MVLYVVTVVTGSGPHAGDENSPRNRLDPLQMSQLHADAVFLLLGLSVGLVLALRATGAPDAAVRAATWLLGIELAQGAVGFVQYFTDLPVVLVGVHMLGAAVISASVTWTLLQVRHPVRSDERGVDPLEARRDLPLAEPAEVRPRAVTQPVAPRGVAAHPLER